LVRRCAETAISIGCVRNDPTFIDRLEEAHERHRASSRNDAPLTETKPTSEASNPLYQAYSYRPQVGDAYMSTITRVRELLGAGASDTTMVL
jgi:hypothetical protein